MKYISLWANPEFAANHINVHMRMKDHQTSGLRELKDESLADMQAEDVAWNWICLSNFDFRLVIVEILLLFRMSDL